MITQRATPDALEEVEDIAALDDAMAEEGPNLPWEQVRADLGRQQTTTGSSCAPPRGQMALRTRLHKRAAAARDLR
jgi:hypothetical protein